jgi:Glutamyl-tRNAGlu reductase, N-terminal domain
VQFSGEWSCLFGALHLSDAIAVQQPIAIDLPSSACLAFMMQVEEWMSQASGVPLEELRQYMFLYHDREATEHIMRVAGGLDSLVMGEGQILAQVPTVLAPHAVASAVSLLPAGQAST